MAEVMEEQELELQETPQVPVQGAGEGAPQEEQLSVKDTFQSNLRKKYPDKTFESDDDYYSASMEGYDKEHEWKKSAIEQNKFMADKLAENPDIAGFIADVVDGKSPKVAAENLRDLFEMDDDEYDEYNKKRNQDKADRDAKVKMYEDNIKQSEEDIKAFAEETGRSEEEAKEFLQRITDEIFSPLQEGIISKDLLHKLDNMFNRDADIASAEESGYMKGRNEKIVDTKLKKAGDGIPALKGKGGATKKDNGQDDWLKQMEERADKKNALWG